ncbi:hypothetical protein OHS81_29230 [Streptomyces sp. NBC_00400]|uniref:hypothetical protein n=1 Tax=Streptomyces sp. NBC_00400 TaxID=2975737 RepID=UPI002E24129D
MASKSVRSTLPGAFLGLWGLSAPVVFAVGATTPACQDLPGTLITPALSIFRKKGGNPS